MAGAVNESKRVARLAALAVQFLTRAPVRVSGTVTPQELGASLLFYPAVGFLLGCVLAGFGAAAAALLPPAVAAVLTVAAAVIVTGNLHLDGLADTADGVYGGYGPGRRLEIMRDSRIGAHGAAALILTLGLKTALLSGMPPAEWLHAMPAAFAAGRWALVYGAYRFPCARPDGVGRMYMEHVRLFHFWCATCIAAASAAVLAPSVAHFAAVAGAAGLIAAAAGHYLNRKLGGMTGDTLGALNEVAEVSALTAFAAVSAG